LTPAAVVEFHLAEHYGGLAVVVRSISIADGIALIGVMLATTEAPEPAAADAPPPPRRSTRW
jgi:hypothetical protein